MSESRAYNTYTAIAIYRDWAERRKHGALAAARYWLKYGVGESGCDHAYLRAWLERWWSRLPADEQRMLERWMESVHRAVERGAQLYVAAQREREERIARAKARWTQLSDGEDSFAPSLNQEGAVQ